MLSFSRSSGLISFSMNASSSFKYAVTSAGILKSTALLLDQVMCEAYQTAVANGRAIDTDRSGIRLFVFPSFHDGKGEQNFSKQLRRSYLHRNSCRRVASSVGFSSGMKWPQSGIEPPDALTATRRRESITRSPRPRGPPPPSPSVGIGSLKPVAKVARLSATSLVSAR